MSSELYTNYYVAMHFSPWYRCMASSGMFIRAPSSQMGLEVGWGGVMGGITKHQTIGIFCRWVKNIKQNALSKTISHPQIATPCRYQCYKEVRGLGNIGSWMWQMQLTLLRGRRDVDAIASDGEWQIWLLISQLIFTHLAASAQCSRGYCRDVCATRFMCCKS